MFRLWLQHGIKAAYLHSRFTIAWTPLYLSDMWRIVIRLASAVTNNQTFFSCIKFRSMLAICSAVCLIIAWHECQELFWQSDSKFLDTRCTSAVDAVQSLLQTYNNTTRLQSATAVAHSIVAASAASSPGTSNAVQTDRLLWPTRVSSVACAARLSRIYLLCLQFYIGQTGTLSYTWWKRGFDAKLPVRDNCWPAMGNILCLNSAMADAAERDTAWNVTWRT